MSDTTKIRYVGPQTEGLWTPAGAYPAFEFPRGEYVEVPAALADELAGQLEPVPPGDPVQDAKTGEWSVKLASVWEIEGSKASKSKGGN